MVAKTFYKMLFFIKNFYEITVIFINNIILS